MEALIDALERATVGKLELDRSIAMELEPLPCEPFKTDLAWGADRRMYYILGRRGKDDKKAKTAPAYTTSLDAALTLVPEGMNWCISNHGQIGAEDMAFAGVFGSPMVGSECDTNAPTSALALCIASLRACQAMKEVA